MDLYKAIRERRSIRKYSSKPVDFDKITLILESGLKAPSAGNLKDTKIILITEKKIIAQVADHCTEQYWISQAPVLFVVCADTEKPERYFGLRGQRLYSVQNAAACIQTMMLAATEFGLSTCWVGSFDETYLSDALGIPEKVRPQAIITLGYGDEEPQPLPEHDISINVFFNKYGNRIKNLNKLMKDYNKEIEKLLAKVEPHTEKMLDKVKGFLKKGNDPESKYK